MLIIICTVQRLPQGSCLQLHNPSNHVYQKGPSTMDTLASPLFSHPWAQELGTARQAELRTTSYLLFVPAYVRLWVPTSSKGRYKASNVGTSPHRWREPASLGPGEHQLLAPLRPEGEGLPADRAWEEGHRSTNVDVKLYIYYISICMSICKHIASYVNL